MAVEELQIVKPYHQTNRFSLYEGDCRIVLPIFAECSIDSIVCDPPYELSNDGKASANRVLLEMMFPEQPNLYADPAGGNMLPFLVEKILDLHRCRHFPTPAPTMPKGSVTLDGDSTGRNENIKDAGIGAAAPTDCERLCNCKTQTSEHLGGFMLELADAAALFNALNHAGCGFLAGGLGIGTRIGLTGLPSLFRGCGLVNNGDTFIGSADYSLSYFVGALRGTEDETVARFDLSRGSIDRFTTTAALVFLACLNESGAKIVRTLSTASSLPSVLEARRICLVSNTTDRTLSFDLLVHPQSLSTKGFMGKSWDGSKIAYDVSVWRECLRVLKPGGHLLAFGGSRTYHRLACAIEDAGFEIRDTITWLFGSGFPKSLNISKAIDAAAGADREVIGSADARSKYDGVSRQQSPERNDGYGSVTDKRIVTISAPTTDAARQWDGWGTALKPAAEYITVARKPLIGTVAQNILEHGTGGLNIDGCRIEGVPPSVPQPVFDSPTGKIYGFKTGEGRNGEMSQSSLGRWPANVIHDGSDEVLAGFPETASAGQYTKSLEREVNPNNSIFGMGNNVRDNSYSNEAGSAARFFYCAKSSQDDRNEGLDDLPVLSAGAVTDRKDGSAGLNSPRAGAGRTNGSRNNHPTVKPTDLMRYLCRLVTPPSGLVLDPFCGSGSTGKAAMLEGLRFIGIELNADYCQLAQRRIEAATRQGLLFT